MNETIELLIIDSHDLLDRHWWASRDRKTPSGRDNSLEAGFLGALRSLRQAHPAAELVLAWDGRPVRQLAENPDYKAHRAASHADRPADWHERCARLRGALARVVPTLYDPDDEADAEIARTVRRVGEKSTLLVSNDHNLLALLTHRVTVLRPGQDPELYALDDFVREYGFPPCRFALFRALTGDGSDGLRGLPYFQKKTAARLAAEFPDVDVLYEALRTGRLAGPPTRLNELETQKLLAGEALVRSNLRICDLAAAGGDAHLTRPDGDRSVLESLLHELELEYLVGLVRPEGGPGSDEAGAVSSSGRPALSLPPVWAERVRQAREQGGERTGTIRVVPLAPARFAGQVNLVNDEAGARQLVRLAAQRPVAWIGLDFEFRHGRPGVFMKRFKGKDLLWHDPHSCVPLLLSVALVESGRERDPLLYRFVVDCRDAATVAPLADLLRLPVPFAGHSLKAELHCLWRLNLPAPHRVWDTWVAEKALLLGLFHARYKKERPADESEAAALKEEAEEEVEFKCDLATTCERRGVLHAFAADKERLQQSFLSHADGAPFTPEQLDYCAADAEAAAQLYPAQLQAAADRGCLQHLMEVEMPWTVTNARLMYDGARVDPVKCRDLLAACSEHRERVASLLREQGLANVNSHPQVKEFFRRLGLLDAFHVGGDYSFDDDHLEAAEGRHPAIAQVRLLRKLHRLLADRGLRGDLVGADGRLHPDHRQLGTDSGRNSMRWPNIGGIGRALRPVVVPEEGYGIGEVDLSQIEVGIAAACYDDPRLVEMFNAGDVYSRMAKSFFAAELPPGSLELPDRVFKKQFPRLRDRMKVFTLAIIYNITPHGLARREGITVEAAAGEQKKFLGMFPRLARALQEASACGAIRGFAYTCSGLRRWRARQGAPTPWEVNWMRNTPVQGSASIVFKVAGNRLYRRFQHYQARMILPMHDAYVFEARLSHLQAVAAITEQVFKSSVQEYFPMLDPQVEVNIDHPECWNKDGHADSLRRWIEDPTSVP
jgi:DNA polymerase-1